MIILMKGKGFTHQGSTFGLKVKDVRSRGGAVVVAAVNSFSMRSET